MKRADGAKTEEEAHLGNLHSKDNQEKPILAETPERFVLHLDDVFHHQTSIDKGMEDEEIVESKSSYFLEDFIVDKSKKSRIKKDEIVEIETPKIDEEIMAEKLRIFNKKELKIWRLRIARFP